MILWLLAYFGGVLTILSPCILPVLPFVFIRSGERSFLRSNLPLLIGMAATFVLISTLAVVGGDRVVHANEWGRALAMIALSVVALTLIFPQLAEKAMHPLLRAGSAINRKTEPTSQDSFLHSFLIGIATGLLWAPCAGPILGLILAGAAIKGASVSTSFLLLAYALGAATSLAAALAAGGKFFKILKRYLGADQWVRRALGICVLVGVLSIALGWDRGVLTRLSRVSTENLEQKLVGLAQSPQTLSTEGPAPELKGAVQWLGSRPLTLAALKGHVVLVDFWTYSCINCLRTLPYIEAWAKKYHDQGLIVIGVHAPEFAFEKDPENVKKAIQEFGITYPVALDNNYAIWNSFQNRYWPAHYFIDAKGVIRHHHFGEGDYAESEKIIQSLLSEANGSATQPLVQVNASGIEAASRQEEVGSPETYLGAARSKNFVAQGTPLPLNGWSLFGPWSVSAEEIRSNAPGGKITFRFHARDLHLVLGPGKSGQAIPFRVRLDGVPPGQNAGVDTDAAGAGVVREERLYQLIRQRGSSPLTDHTFEIEFSAPGVEAFAFTFG